MRNKQIIILIIAAAVSASEVFAESQTKILIHLPREINVDANSVTLGDIGVISGNEELSKTAAGVQLGTLRNAGQQIVLDRNLILSRLASNKIPKYKVVFSGAQEVVISGRYKIIESDEITECARKFLENNLPAGAICASNPIKPPEKFILSARHMKSKLIPGLAKEDSSNIISVEIAAADGESIIAKRQVSFRLKYRSNQAIAIREIAAGEALTQDNLKIEEAISDEPEDISWKPPYGCTAKRRLRADTVIKPDMYISVQQLNIIEKNKNVVIRIDSPLYVITATGKALQNGKVGECIKVQNIESQKVILAKVKEDGTVEPVF